jgi:hypothetical protein
MRPLSERGGIRVLRESRTPGRILDGAKRGAEFGARFLRAMLRANQPSSIWVTA